VQGYILLIKKYQSKKLAKEKQKSTMHGTGWY
jgi:hypothetical protein